MGIVRRWLEKRQAVKHAEIETRKKSTTWTVTIGADGFINSDYGMSSSLDQLLLAQSWAYACVTKNAEAIAALPAMVQTNAGGTWATDRRHELNGLIAAPLGTAKARISWQQLIEASVQHQYIAGNAYWRIAKIGQSIGALFPLYDPLGVTAELDRGFPASYKLGTETYQANEIVNLMNCSPGSTWKGVSSFEAALRAITIDRTAHERIKANLVNRIQPGYILKLDLGYGLDEETETALKEKLTEAYQAATKDGLPMVLDRNAEVVLPPPIQHQIDYKDSRAQARDEILAIFGVPPPILGVIEKATYANIREARSIWWDNELFPRIDALYNAINAQAVWPTYGNNVRLWYDLTGSQIGLQNTADRIGIAKELVAIGYPANIAAAYAGLNIERVPGLDAVNTQITIAGREQQA